MENFNHTHCLICGAERDLAADEHAKEYICKPCVASFPGDYLLYRLQCYREGICKREFDILETRLSPSFTLDLNRFSDFELCNTYEDKADEE